MKKIMMVGLFLVAAVGMCAGQTYWKKSYGGAKWDEAKAIKPTLDGNFILAGYTESFGKGGSDIYLLKIDAGGDTIWTKTYGGVYRDYAEAITPTPDGNFIVAGAITPFSPSDVFLLKIKPDGDTLWTKTYGGTTSDEFAQAITPTPDGNFIVAGLTYGYGTVNDAIYLLKIKPNGDTLWTKTYGVTGDYEANAITATQDGNFIVAGTCHLGYYKNIYLLKITTGGDTLWTKTYGGTTSNVCAWAITPTLNGNFIIAGDIYLGPFGNSPYNILYLLKINSSGDTLWSKTYGIQQNEQATAITPTSDGNFIVAGYTSRSDFIGNEDAYLLKINSSGDTLWTKIYGGSNRYNIDAITPTKNGNFIVTGTLDSNVFVFFLIDDRYAYKNSLFTFKIPVSGDSLNHGYTPIKIPAGMTVSNGGTISWTPTTDSSYMDHVEFLVFDDMGNKDTLTFNIFVNSKDHPTKTANPVARLTNHSPNDISINQFSSKEVRFSLPAGTKSFSIYDIRGQLLENISVKGNQAAWLPKHATGRYFAKAILEKRETVKPFMLLK
jgi:hypothetical protein